MTDSTDPRGPRYSRDELAAELGASPELVERLWNAFGFARRTTDEKIFPRCRGAAVLRRVVAGHPEGRAGRDRARRGADDGAADRLAGRHAAGALAQRRHHVVSRGHDEGTRHDPAVGVATAPRDGPGARPGHARLSRRRDATAGGVHDRGRRVRRHRRVHKACRGVSTWPDWKAC